MYQECKKLGAFLSDTVLYLKSLGYRKIFCTHPIEAKTQTKLLLIAGDHAAAEEEEPIKHSYDTTLDTATRLRVVHGTPARLTRKKQNACLR